MRTSPAFAARWSTRPQPGLNGDLDVHPTLARHHGGNLGVWTTAFNDGMIAENDLAHGDADSQPDH